MSWQDDGTYSKLFGEPKGELKRAKMSPKAKIAGASLSALVLLTVAGTIALSGGRHDPADPAVDGAAGSDASPPDHAVPHASLNCPAVANGWAACSGHLACAWAVRASCSDLLLPLPCMRLILQYFLRLIHQKIKKKK